MMTPRSLITVVDNDKLVRNAIRRLLQSLGFSVAAYASAEAYLQSGLIAQTACLILDVRMTDMTGLELQGFLAANGLRTPIVFVSTSANVTTRAQAFQAGAVDFLHKPATDTALLNAISAALRRNECCEGKNPACAGAA